MDEPSSIAGLFYYQGDFRRLEVEISEGKISKISKALGSTKMTSLDGAILPGSVDPHVHFRDPGETWKEDFHTGSMAAVYGGTTAVIDMPNNRVPIDNYSVYMNKLGTVGNKSYVDFGLASMFTGSNSSILHKESSLIKIFMGGSTNSVAVGEISAKEMEALKQFKAPKVFHLEDGKCLADHTGREDSLQDHDVRRPVECEQKAFSLVREMDLGKKIAAHCSSYKSGMEKGFDYLEVTPHHMLLNTGMKLGSEGKVNPPLRSRDVQETVLNAYITGKFSFVGSDHAPHSDEDKNEFDQAKSGIIGVETRLPLMAALVTKKVLSLDTFIKTNIVNAAEAYGIKKGKIEIGYDADFVAIDFSSKKRLNENRLHSKRTVSPFNGFDVVFPSDVFIRGRKVIEDYELIDDPSGRYMPSSLRV
jgi:dihydroorotase